MPPTPPSSSGHSPEDVLHTSGSNSNPYRVVRKRNRVPLSCGPCRNRKLKCNRKAPCENCTKRGDGTSCTYATSSGASRARKQSGSSTGSDEMQSRIDRLENLVLSLMGGNGNGTNRDRSSSTDTGHRYSLDGEEDAMHSVVEEGQDDDVEDEVEEVKNALGIMKIHGGKSFYRGETHWASILSEITEVKKFFEETKQKYEMEVAQLKQQSLGDKLESTGFPFSAARPPTKKEVLDLIPRQEIVDYLVDAYFRNFDPIFHVLHRPTFYKQYEAFWDMLANDEQCKIDCLWVGLLMCIMSISSRMYHFSGEEPPELAGKTLQMSLAFRTAAEQCLIIGEFTKRHFLYTVQSLILMCTASEKKDSLDTTWLFLGMVIRIAMSMGLHRDPSQYGAAIPPGEGEIRRRLWTVITCMDLLFSIQIGLPSMIRQEECDTKIPLNLHDDEIGEDVTELPPERGKDELTGVSYMIAKASMSFTYLDIVNQVNSVHARPPYDQILRLDRQIEERYAHMPGFLHIKSYDESKNDPAWLILQRYNLNLLKHKALITLHRPYAARANTNSRYQHSRDRCVSAAMVLLQTQADVVNQTHSALKHARWFTETMASSASSEYLHAAMIVCLDLSRSCKRTPGDTSTYISPEKRVTMYQSLMQARDLYAKQSDSHDAQKAYGILSVMLEKLQNEDNRQTFTANSPVVITPTCSNTDSTPSTLGGGPDISAATSTTTLSDPDPVKSEQAAAMTLGQMSSGLTPNAVASLFNAPGSVTTPGGSLPMPDMSPGPIPAAVSSSTEAMNSLSPPTMGLSGLTPPGNWWGWGGNEMSMPQNLEWDQWDDFMQGINLDTSQMGGYPILPGLTNQPYGLEQVDKKDGIIDGGGGGGGSGGGTSNGAPGSGSNI